MASHGPSRSFRCAARRCLWLYSLAAPPPSNAVLWLGLVGEHEEMMRRADCYSLSLLLFDVEWFAVPGLETQRGLKTALQSPTPFDLNWHELLRKLFPVSLMN